MSSTAALIVTDLVSRQFLIYNVQVETWQLVESCYMRLMLNSRYILSIF